MLFTNKAPIEYESPAGFREVAVGAALTLSGYVKGRRGLGLTLRLILGYITDYLSYLAALGSLTLGNEIFS
jgi:hypothetical protein